jgi:hypothetical protein
MAMLDFYYLMGYTLETISDEVNEEDEDRRFDAAVKTIREWRLQKEWGEWEERMMKETLIGLMRGVDEINFRPNERRASVVISAGL